MVNALANYLSYDFVQHALIAGTLSAILGAVVGYFVVIRNVGFAAHALGHIGFTGATGAVLFGLSPLVGMLLFTSAAGVVMGLSGEKVHRSEVAIGMVLSVALGIGTLFLAMFSGFSGQASAILFGNIFGVSSSQIVVMVVMSILSIAALMSFSRRLLFASVQPDLAAARGISLQGIAVAFMVVLAISVTLASQVVGILLVFTLVIAPAGIASRFFRTFWSGILASVGIGLAAVWLGIFLACATNYPVSFWIPALLFALYVASELVTRFVLRTER